MKSIKSAITIIALVATAFSCGVAGAESITVEMESVREDSVEHLFQPILVRGFPIGAELTEGLPEIQSVAGLEISMSLMHARLSFLKIRRLSRLLYWDWIMTDGTLPLPWPIRPRSRSDSSSRRDFSKLIEE